VVELHGLAMDTKYPSFECSYETYTRLYGVNGLFNQVC